MATYSAYSPIPPPEQSYELAPDAAARRQPGKPLTYDAYGGYASEDPSRPSSPRPSEHFDGNNTQYGVSDFEGLIPKPPEEQQVFKAYKRRWIGLAVLSFLNVIHAWSSLQYTIVTPESAEWFKVSMVTVDWFSTASSLVYLPIAPVIVWAINKRGSKFSIILSGVLLVLGNWVRYAATLKHSFAVALVGNTIIGAGQAFVLTVPTSYSKQWFPERGRTIATGIGTLSESLGSGVGALITPMLYKDIGMSGQILLTAILSTVAFVPTIFIPKAPPTPPSSVSTAGTLKLKESLIQLARTPPFYLQFTTFCILYAAIQSAMSLIVQAILPYGGTPQEGADATTLFIFVGLPVAFIVSPIIDKFEAHLAALRTTAPLLAIIYTTLIFIPQTKSPAALYIVMSAMGATAFSTTPCVLEFQARWTHPVPPEFTSVVCWTGGHLASAVAVIIMSNLINKKPELGQPVGSAIRGFIFMTAFMWVIVPCAWLTGVWIFKRSASSKVAK